MEKKQLMKFTPKKLSYSATKLILWRSNESPFLKTPPINPLIVRFSAHNSENVLELLRLSGICRIRLSNQVTLSINSEGRKRKFLID